jgi:hypothetical protein
MAGETDVASLNCRQNETLRQSGTMTPSELEGHTVNRLAAVVALALAVSTAARAEIVQITYTGTVTSGTDTQNLFGGGSLVGDSFTAVYTINTSLGSIATDGSTYSIWVNTPPASAMTEILTINESNAEIFSNIAGPASETYQLYGFNNPALNSDFGLGSGLLYGFFSTIGSGINITAGNVIMSTTPITSGYEFSSPSSYDTQSSDASLGYFDYLSDFLLLNNASVSVADLAPEPGAWALMLGGFGAVGSALRNRRRRATRPA